MRILLPAALLSISLSVAAADDPPVQLDPVEAQQPASDELLRADQRRKQLEKEQLPQLGDAKPAPEVKPPSAKDSVHMRPEDLPGQTLYDQRKAEARAEKQP